MAANTGQKIFIWVIAVTMLVGTIGASFLIILANDNTVKEQKEQKAQLAKMQKQQEEEQKQKLTSLRPLPGYKAEKFAAADVRELVKKDLKKGSGTAVKGDSDVKVNYFGWTSDGKIFDSTNQGGKVEPGEFNVGQTIKGWITGLSGAKEGGVRQLTIPADQGYGEAGSGTIIPPNAPLMFIIEVIDVK
ncbi:peptidylprolyl isomerase, FKBP-type [candidate division TM7 genomosp. GTL1]|nr:peptidylprolyl isomerase, FKBP-type [candidate division TM7 genomosp. GTL1]